MLMPMPNAVENGTKIENWKRREESLKLERGGEGLYRKLLANIERLNNDKENQNR